MAFQKGHKLAKGRPLGSQNKTGLAVKEIIEACFEGIGGLPRMIKWAKKNDENLGEFYKIFSKLLPKDVNVNATLLTKSEPVPEFNRWIAGVISARPADEGKDSLPH